MNKNAKLILDVVTNSSGHLTAEQIHMALRDRGDRMALATVYNNLAQLYSEGLIRKVSVEGYPDRYDKMTPHDHLVCRVCGKLADIRFKDLTALLQSQTDEELLSYDLKAVYICPACRRAMKPADKNNP